jgi:hypothetical protein
MPGGASRHPDRRGAGEGEEAAISPPVFVAPRKIKDLRSGAWSRQRRLGDTARALR